LQACNVASGIKPKLQKSYDQEITLPARSRRMASIAKRAGPEEFMNQSVDTYRGRDYWIVENQLYAEPSFRLRKCAKFVNQLAGQKRCTLLDVGCGPAALRPLLSRNVTYFGMDIAIQQPASYLRELDFSRNRIEFDGTRFDFVTAMGFFEYMGQQQNQKFEEIRDILNDDGKFIMTYINFGHYRRQVWPNYNNVQSIAEMTRSLEPYFHVDRRFPASHHWRQKQPGKNSLPGLQIHLNFNIPVFSNMFAVEYLFICSKKRK
jgi:SAM-dependent methyltransferase